MTPVSPVNTSFTSWKCWPHVHLLSLPLSLTPPTHSHQLIQLTSTALTLLTHKEPTHLIHSLALTHLLTHSFTNSRTNSLTHSFTNSRTNSLTHSLTHSPTHLLTHLLTHSPTDCIFVTGQVLQSTKPPARCQPCLCESCCYHQLLTLICLSVCLYRPTVDCLLYWCTETRS